MFVRSTLIALAVVLATSASPLFKREVPQEHSHEKFVRSVKASLDLNNPNQIQDPVFALLGNKAAAAGAGKITDLDCLQAATADQAFTNAKAAGDVNGMIDAMIFRALERNTGSVGLASAPCVSFKAVNPEIAALQQHQDAASNGAQQINLQIEQTLAQQIAALGGDPLLALQSGTFAPGDKNDNTGKGNTCDDANDAEGCIFSQNLLTPAASEADIQAAVAGVAASPTINNNAAAAACPAAVTVTVTAAAANAAINNILSQPAAPQAAAAPQAQQAQAAAAGGNLQTFTGALGGISAPAVTAGGRGFVVENNSDFLNLSAALGRSCDVQHNQCANAANGGGQNFKTSDCETQLQQCKAAAQ